MSTKDKQIKENYVNQVIAQLKQKGFEATLNDTEQKDFIKMMAAAYYSGQAGDDQTLQYIADIVEDQEKKKTVIGIMRTIKAKYQLQAKNRAKTQKIQKDKKRQANKDKAEQKLDEVKKKVKTDGPQIKNQEGDQQKEQKYPPGHQKGLKQQLEVQGKTKCKFFPFCKNQQTCQFFHPTQKVFSFKFIK